MASRPFAFGCHAVIVAAAMVRRFRLWARRELEKRGKQNIKVMVISRNRIALGVSVIAIDACTTHHWLIIRRANEQIK